MPKKKLPAAVNSATLRPDGTPRPSRDAFADQVRRAQPLARRLLFEGINILRDGDSDIMGTEITGEVSDLIGEDICVLMGPNGERLDLIEGALLGALALGVALGRMLRPEAFEQDDAAR